MCVTIVYIMVETFQIDITIRFKTPVTKPHFRKFLFKFSEQFPREFNLFFQLKVCFQR